MWELDWLDYDVVVELVYVFFFDGGVLWMEVMSDVFLSGYVSVIEVVILKGIFGLLIYVFEGEMFFG